MQLELVKRTQDKISLALQGPSGSGKTFSSLLLAYGITGNWSKIAVIDTESNSASLCSHLGAFTTIQMGAPYHPSRFYEAVDLCEDCGIEVIIIDSLSKEWNGEGGATNLIEKSSFHEMLEHRSFMNLLFDSKAHIICTMRSRQRLVHRVERTVKYWEVWETPIQEEGIEYSFTTVLKLDNRQHFHVVKDRSGVFMDKEPQRLEMDHGMFLSNWCRVEDIHIPILLQQKINACQTQEELQLLLVNEDVDMAYMQAFTQRRLELDGLTQPLNAA